MSHELKSLTEEELNKLTNHELVKRMDDFLIQRVKEQYNNVLPPSFLKDALNRLPTVNKIFETKKIKKLDNELQRKIIYKIFSFLTQMNFAETSAAASNIMFYNKYDENSSWKSPRGQTIHAAIEQWQIIVSRIAMEIFMDILYLIDTGKDLKPTNKSKFRSFKNWLLKTNDFGYFAMATYKAFLFDRKKRTPEVHGGSKTPKQLLLLRKPLSQNTFELTNILMNIWQPLAEICNEIQPRSVHGDGEGTLFNRVNVVLSGEKEEIHKTVELIINEMNN